MRALGYAVREALGGLRRDWRSGSLALVVVASAVFVTAVSLAVARGIDRLVDRLASGADLSVFLALEASPADRAHVEQVLASAAIVERVAFVPEAEARQRLLQAYPDLAPLLADGFALPTSFDVVLRGTPSPADVEQLIERLRAVPNVDDVRHDRVVLERAAALAQGARLAGMTVASVLGLAGALAIFSVIRLAYVARRDEVEILYLVGAPLAAIRGPFVVEGALQATLGALLGIVLTTVLLGVVQQRVTGLLAGLGADRPWLTVPASLAGPLVLAAAVLGATAAWLAVRSAGRAFTS